jgi:lactoylglutathione lyase
MATTKKRSPKKSGLAATFNHAMIYARDIPRSMRFYQDVLGFKMMEAFPPAGSPVYARLRSPIGETTIALHQARPGDAIASDGIRLYFEVKQLDALCKKLQGEGVEIKQMPKSMPWGWRHAYLDDPDGHELSLYWAGRKRFQKTNEAAMKRAAR